MVFLIMSPSHWSHNDGIKENEELISYKDVSENNNLTTECFTETKCLCFHRNPRPLCCYLMFTIIYLFKIIIITLFFPSYYVSIFWSSIHDLEKIVFQNHMSYDSIWFRMTHSLSASFVSRGRESWCKALGQLPGPVCHTNLTVDYSDCIKYLVP